jgi:hypothetical protein
MAKTCREESNYFDRVVQSVIEMRGKKTVYTREPQGGMHRTAALAIVCYISKLLQCKIHWDNLLCIGRSPFP